MKNVYPVLNEHVLLMVRPKGGLIGRVGTPFTYVNDTAVDILELCDGTRTIGIISEILAKKHHEDIEKVCELVSDFLQKAAQKGHIVYSCEPAEILGILAGNRDYVVPMDMSCDITLQCDLQCIHCYAEAGSRKDALSTQKWLKGLQKIRQAGVAKIVLTGGDPPAHPDFFEILRFCAQTFLIVDIATNGYRISEEMVRKISKIKKIGIITCRLSIDGSELTHDKIRGVKGSWRRATEAVTLLSGHNIPVSVTMTLNADNVADLEEVIQTAKTCGASRFSAGMTLEKGRACGKNLELTRTQKRDVSERLKDLAQKYASPTFYVSTWIGVSERDTPTPAPSQEESINCGAGYQMFSVDYAGNVKPCPAFNYTMGNIITGELEDIFNSPLIDFFAALKWPTRKMCGDCEHFHICTECHAAAFVKSQKVRTCPWVAQWATLPDGVENPFTE